MKMTLSILPLGLGLAALLVAGPELGRGTAAANAETVVEAESYDWQMPDERLMAPFKERVPIVFVTRNQNAREWDRLPGFWNEASEQVADPKTGQVVERKVVKIKVPLGLSQPPPVPLENPMTVAKWALGKRLFFDGVLSSDGSVSCASCHNPRKGFADGAPVATGIKGLKGSINTPTVLNSAFNTLQFWDGRALSLEDQAQGPVQNPLEMFDGEGNAWHKAVQRLRADQEYVRAFRRVFGHDPTRDAVAKALAAYERTVFSGNSVHDRAELAMRKRVDEEETGKYVLQPKDYETVLKDAISKKDLPALEALGLGLATDAGKVSEVARRINQGRELFFGKARCNGCHVGDNFTDNLFHNLGVGTRDGVLPPDALGRFARLPTGHKNAELAGAFKTPTLRGLLGTAPYMHDASLTTLEQVVDFYDRGGNINEFLDVKLRDYEAEKAFELSRRNGTPHRGPEVKLFGKDQKPVVPLKLNLSAEEKADLVLFLRALQGDPVDPIVADRSKLPQ